MQKAVTSFTDHLVPDYLILNIALDVLIEFIFVHIVPVGYLRSHRTRKVSPFIFGGFPSTTTLTPPNPPVDAPTFYVYPYSKFIRWCV